jgi:hypothetical protein
LCLECGKSFVEGKWLVKHRREVHKIVDSKKVDVDVKMELEGPPGEDSILPDIPGDAGDVPEALQDPNLDPEDPLLESGERKRKADPRPFKCPHCEREYRRKRELESHLLFHAGEEPTHECSLCRKRFFQPRSLRRHMSLHSAGGGGHGCQHCERVFAR